MSLIELFRLNDLIIDRLLNSQKVFPLKKKKTYRITCPVTNQKLVYPCISQNCTHDTRIELKAFLQFSYTHQEWICPFCKSQTQLQYIFIDSILLTAISEAPQSTQDVIIDLDYNYSFSQLPTSQQFIKRLLVNTTRERHKHPDLPLEDFRGFIRTQINQFRKDLSPMIVQQNNEENMIFSQLSFQEKSVSYLSVPSIFWFPHGYPDTHVYNFQNFQWQNAPHLPNIINHIFDFSVVYVQNWAYIIGGIDNRLNPSKNCYKISNVWGFHKMTSLLRPRYRFAHAALSSKIFAIGGFNKDHIMNSVEMFNINTQEWEFKCQISIPRAGGTACSLNEETIELFGGTSDKFAFVVQIQEYHVSADYWELLFVEIPVGLIGLVAFNVPKTQKILLFGGYSELLANTKVFLFNRPNKSWLQDLPEIEQRLLGLYSFPLVYDKKARILHIFNQQQGKVTHIFYSIIFIQEEIEEEHISCVGIPKYLNSTIDSII